MEIVAKPFEITRIRLENIRGFRELDLDISSHDGAPRKRTLIIGKNGTCKSALLRAIAIGLTDDTDASRLISEPIGGLVTSYQYEAKSPASGFSTPASISIRIKDREETGPAIE